VWIDEDWDEISHSSFVNMVMNLQVPYKVDYSFNVHLKRNLIHKNKYLQGCIKKATVNQIHKHTFMFSALFLGAKVHQSLFCVDDTLTSYVI
jgi:hypothetical protein